MFHWSKPCQYGQGQCSLAWKLYQIYDNKDDDDDDEDIGDDCGDDGDNEGDNDDDDGDNESDDLMMVW